MRRFRLSWKSTAPIMAMMTTMNTVTTAISHDVPRCPDLGLVSGWSSSDIGMICFRRREGGRNGIEEENGSVDK
ncbi:hypothetical protein BDQ17DRAFT_1342251 [Cyathus striatus]|nr:hypothetical protein BDQ17DRAFT_1342251 [Cyathus striatus]